MNHVQALQEMIDEAFLRGSCYRQVEPGLHYVVDRSEDIDGFKAASNCIKTKAYVCMVNTLKWNNTAYYPFTLSIANPERLYEFYNGDSVISIVVELDHIEQFFSSRGFSTIFSSEGPWFLKLEKKESSEKQAEYVNVSVHIWNRLFAEFVGLEWLLTEVIGKFARMDSVSS